jgi:hypothetical protein
MEEDLTATRIAVGSSAADCFDAGATLPSECFDRPSRWAAWLKCEAALAMAEAEIGIIPTVRDSVSSGGVHRQCSPPA